MAAKAKMLEALTELQSRDLSHLPTASSSQLLSIWAAGKPDGLSVFKGKAPDDTAMNWNAYLLEGKRGGPPSASSVIPSIGTPTFVCSRGTVIRQLAHRLTLLDEGQLRGQSNCFVVLGTRGVGKTHLMDALALTVVALVGAVALVFSVRNTTLNSYDPYSILGLPVGAGRSGGDCECHTGRLCAPTVSRERCSLLKRFRCCRA